MDIIMKVIEISPIAGVLLIVLWQLNKNNNKNLEDFRKFTSKVMEESKDREEKLTETISKNQETISKNQDIIGSLSSNVSMIHEIKSDVEIIKELVLKR